MFENDIPAFLARTQPRAQYAVTDDGRLCITIGDVTQTLMREDVRRLDVFLNQVGAALQPKGAQP